MSMSEIQEAAEEITGAVSPDANIIFGASIRPELQDEIVITVVATGFDSDVYRKKRAEEEEKKRTDEALNRVETLRNQQQIVDNTPSFTQEVNEQATADEFTSAPKENIWDKIGKQDDEEDLEVPPSLRAKLRGKK